MKIEHRAALLAVVCLLWQAVPGFAQHNPPEETARIAGVVKDPSGAVIPGASVVLRDAANKGNQTRITDNRGKFEFSSLAAGDYQLSVSAAGFLPQRMLGVAARPGEEASASTTLKIAPATTSIEVRGDATSTLAGTANQPRLGELARSRNTAETIANVPGVSLRSNGELASIPMLNGLGDERTKIRVDGATIGNSCPNHTNPQLSYTAPAQASMITVLPGITPVSLGGDSVGGTILVESALPVFAERDTRIEQSGSTTVFYRSNGNSYGGSMNAWVAGRNLGIGYTSYFTNSDNYTDGSGHKITSSYAQSTDQVVTVAARGGGNLFALRAGLHHTPYEGFTGARMDLIRDLAYSLNLRYRRDIGHGMLDTTVFWQNTFHEMNIGHDKSTFPMPMYMPMNSHGRDIGYSARYELPLSQRATLRVGNELHRFVLDDRWPAVPGREPMMGPNTFVNINNGRRIRLGSYAEVFSRWSTKWSTIFGVRNDTVWTDAGDVQGYSPMYAADADAFNAVSHARTDANVDVTALARYDANAYSGFEFGFARKSRAPNLYERYAWSTSIMTSGMIGWFNDGNYYVGNLNLKPEVGNTVSGTVVLHGGETHGWEVRLTPYFTYVQNYVDVDVFGTVVAGMSTFSRLRFANHDARLYGGSLSGSVTLWNNVRAGKGRLTTVGGWVRGTRTASGTGLYQMMPLNLRLALDEELKGVTFGFGAAAVDRKSRLDPNRLEQATPGYVLFDLHAGYRTRFLQAGVSLQNLINRRYELPLGGVNMDDFLAGMQMEQIQPLTGRGRSVSFSLTANF